MERATLRAAVTELPEWLQKHFEERKIAAKQIADPIKRRMAQLDIEQERDKVLANITTKATSFQ